jgi:hypothetical protein
MTDDQTNVETNEPTNVEEAAHGAADAPAEPDPSPASPEPRREAERGQDDAAKGNREAAKWRRSFREEQRKTEQLQARLDQHDRAEVERIAARELADPSDLWIVTSLDELRDDGGDLDPEKVKAQVSDALSKKPHWRKPVEQPDDLGAGAARGKAVLPDRRPSFGEALKGGRR